MKNNKWQELKELKAEINLSCKEAENKNELTHIRQQVCEYLLQRSEDINDYESELNDLSEIVEDPTDTDEIQGLKEALKYSINILLIYTEQENTRTHLKNMYRKLTEL